MCTYLQVSPGFVWLLSSLGSRVDRDVAFSLHKPQLYNDSINASAHPTFCIPTLARSGHELRVFYKVCGMEVSDLDGKYSIEETMVYHTLDLSNGRALWLIVKANGIIKERVVEGNGGIPLPPARVQDSAVVTLVTHMVVLQWATEGWMAYLDGLEQRVFDICTRPIPELPLDDLRELGVIGMDALRAKLTLKMNKSVYDDFLTYYRHHHGVLAGIGEFTEEASEALQDGFGLFDAHGRTLMEKTSTLIVKSERLTGLVNNALDLVSRSSDHVYSPILTAYLVRTIRWNMTTELGELLHS
jgi:hypothetical protein